jgi:Putative Actinobacterial Holin-X, holin superfamily III
VTARQADDLTVEPSLGQLVSTATADLSELLRKEVQLAKLEITQEVVRAGKGAGMLGGAGVAAGLGALFLNIALAFAIGSAVGLGWGFAIVGLLYLVAAGALALTGKKGLSRLGPPTRTIETVKDDLDWAKHPTHT